MSANNDFKETKRVINIDKPDCPLKIARMYACMHVWYRYEFPLRLRRVDFLCFEKLEFAEMMLSKFLQVSKEQLLETSES